MVGAGCEDGESGGRVVSDLQASKVESTLSVLYR